MEPTSCQSDRDKVWDLIKHARTALLVTVGENDALEARPMGCLQTAFDGTLWFLTFRHSSKLHQISRDDRVLVAYVNPERYEYVAVSGRARIVDDRQKLKELWTEGLRVWFPKGPNDPELALLAIDVEKADYWANPASAITYALAYMKARVSGESPSPDKIAESKSVHFRPGG
jgi:general stress protein 26